MNAFLIPQFEQNFPEKAKSESDEGKECGADGLS
jgi:hypothetical protein